MNIVYGGSFNPPTVAHQQIIARLEAEFHPEHIIIVPTGDAYDWKDKAPFAHRYAMAKLAFPGCLVSNIEQEPKFRGTVNTLRELGKKYDDLHFCMGADNVISIQKWKDYQQLVENNRFLVFQRDGIDVRRFLTEQLPAYAHRFTVLPFRMDVSATAYRQTGDASLIPPAVLIYIQEHSLYT